MPKEAPYERQNRVTSDILLTPPAPPIERSQLCVMMLEVLKVGLQQLKLLHGPFRLPEHDSKGRDSSPHSLIRLVQIMVDDLDTQADLSQLDGLSDLVTEPLNFVSLSRGNDIRRFRRESKEITVNAS